jgi:hypothetical protein
MTTTLTGLRKWLQNLRDQRQPDHTVICQYPGCRQHFDTYPDMWRHQEREH